MSRASVMAGFHGHHGGHQHQQQPQHGHQHGQVNQQHHHYHHTGAGHYGVGVGVGAGAAGTSQYEALLHSGLAFAQTRPPMRAPVLVPAGGFNQQHTGHHLHGRPRPAAAAANFNINNINPLHHHLHQHQQQQHQHHASMADPYMPTDEEMAHLQKLSSEFEPEVSGPLVGERQSSAAITTEYASADPVYRAKTAALPAKYAYFRTCRGDGHCGWRAIAFTYFEALLRVGDAHRFEEEEARLTSYGNLFDQIGYVHDIWYDFADEAFILMRKLSESLHNMDGNAADILLATFNDMGASMGIITYVKFLASAWIQTHPDDYRHFVPMGDVKGYCSNNIEPTQCEADNIGIAALAEALIKPAGFGLEVWYLDRSPGEEINRSFYTEPTDHAHNPIPNAPMLRLLYRPGHYDILYKAEDVPAPMNHQPVPSQPPLQVHLANSFDDFIPTASNIPDVMTMIPGMSGAFPSGIGQRWASLSYDFSSSPAPQHCAPVQPYPSAPALPTPVTSSHLDFVVPAQVGHTNQYNPPSHHNIQLDQPPVTLPIHPAPPTSTNIERAAPLNIERGGPFRPSIYELEPGFGSGLQTQPFQTSIFRNSHFNTSHFMNPEFQPEQWSPDGEYATGNRGRHKSYSS